ncbi:MAG: amidohydrolase [Anaerolineales bacterium]
MADTIVIKNADIVTLDSAGTIQRATDMAITEGRIAAIGDVDASEADELIDATGCVVMPGFFNTHSHAAMSLVRGWAEDLPFPRWLNEKIWVAESALTSDDVYWGALLAAAEMIRSGTVAFNDHYFYMNRVAEAVGQSGLRAMLTQCVFGIGEDKEIGGGLDAALNFINEHDGAHEGRIRTALGPHSPYICPPDFLREIARLAEELDQPVHIHLSETQEQIDVSREKYGKTPTEHLYDLGIFAGRAIAAHGLALTDDDLRILAENDVVIARTPITYMKLAMPMNQITDLQAAGITVTLGSDGPGSNNDMDMFAVMRQATLLEKYLGVDPERLAGDLPLRMATQYGARALGFINSGVIEVGATADVIVVDFNAPHLYPRHDLVAHLVHSAKAGDVRHTIVDGKVLMRDRQLLTLDLPEILRQAEAHAFRMVGADMQQVRNYSG